VLFKSDKLIIDHNNILWELLLSQLSKVAILKVYIVVTI